MVAPFHGAGLNQKVDMGAHRKVLARVLSPQRRWSAVNDGWTRLIERIEVIQQTATHVLPQPPGMQIPETGMDVTVIGGGMAGVAASIHLSALFRGAMRNWGGNGKPSQRPLAKLCTPNGIFQGSSE